MGKGNVVIYIVVSIIGLIASSLGYVAEATKIKVSDVSITEFDTCNYPRTPANILGYLAALLTLINQIIISIVTYYYACFEKNISTTDQQSEEIVHFTISWIASLVGIVLLVAAAILSTRQEFLDATELCYAVKPGLFGAGGSLALVASMLGLCAYNFSTKRYPQRALPAGVPNQGGVAMGIPLFAPPSANTNLKPQQ